MVSSAPAPTPAAPAAAEVRAAAGGRAEAKGFKADARGFGAGKRDGKGGDGADDAKGDGSAAPPVNPKITAALRLVRRAAVRAAAAVSEADAAVADAEEAYLTQPFAHGNLVRGWDVNSRRMDRAPASGNGVGSATGAPKMRKIALKERIFSLTSSTSAARAEAPGGDVGGVRKGGVVKKKKKRV